MNHKIFITSAFKSKIKYLEENDLEKIDRAVLFLRHADKEEIVSDSQIKKHVREKNDFYLMKVESFRLAFSFEGNEIYLLDVCPAYDENFNIDLKVEEIESVEEGKEFRENKTPPAKASVYDQRFEPREYSSESSTFYSTTNVQLDCFLPSERKLECSALLRFAERSIRSLMLTFSHKTLNQILFRGLHTDNNEGRGFFWLKDEDSGRIGVNFGGAHFYISSEDFDQLCMVVDKVGDQYFEEALNVEKNKWKSLEFEYLGTGLFRLGSVALEDWINIWRFSKKHNEESPIAEFFFDSVSIHNIQVLKFKGNGALDHYVQLNARFRDSESLDNCYNPRAKVDIIWSSERNRNIRDGSIKGTAKDAYCFLFNQMIPWVMEDIDGKDSFLSRLFGDKTKTIERTNEIFSKAYGFESFSQSKESKLEDQAKEVGHKFQTYFHLHHRTIFKKEVGILGLDLLKLMVSKAKIPTEGIEYICGNIGIYENKSREKIQDYISDQKVTIEKEKIVNGERMDYILRGVATSLDHKQLSKEFIPDLLKSFEAIYELIKIEVYRERLSVNKSEL